VFDETGVIATGSSSALLAEHPDAVVRDVRGCVVTPGMVNAHQHFTGDPLVRSCIPDLLAPGVSIFEWSVPLHGEHTGDDDEVSATLCAVESLRNGVTTVIEQEATRDHTERLLRHFGADVRTEPDGSHGRRIVLTGQPELVPAPVVVPADPSSAAFPLVAALIVPRSGLGH